MLKCAYCGYENVHGELYCEDCGKSLTEVPEATIPTRMMFNDLNDAAAKATWGRAQLSEGSTVQLFIHGYTEPIIVNIKRRIMLGRSDTSSTSAPEIDFAEFKALEKGVSRSHAMIELTENSLVLIDVGSANGTYLNGQKLSANQPRLLRDGDEIRLGKLITRIFFS